MPSRPSFTPGAVPRDFGLHFAGLPEREIQRIPDTKYSEETKGELDGSAGCTIQVRNSRYGLYLSIRDQKTKRFVHFDVSKSSKVSRGYEASDEKVKDEDTRIYKAKQTRVDADEGGFYAEKQEVEIRYTPDKDQPASFVSVKIENVDGEIRDNGDIEFKDSKPEVMLCIVEI